MKFKPVLLATLFVASLTTAGLIVAKVRKAPKSQGFTMRISQRFYAPGSSVPYVFATVYRQQKADGSWRFETTYADGRVQVGLSQPGRGVFEVDDKGQKLDQMAESSGHFLITEEMLRSDPAFVGEEEILGFKTLHLRAESQLAPGEFDDNYFCPALQGYPLRSVSSSTKHGTTTVFEVTEVKLGEPSFPVPDYAVDTTQFEQLQKARAANAP